MVKLAHILVEQNRTEQNFIGNYKAPATPRWHKSKPYKYKIQEAYKTHTCYMYNIHSREFKCRFINNISKFEGKGVCLNGSLFYHVYSGSFSRKIISVYHKQNVCLYT